MQVLLFTQFLCESLHYHLALRSHSTGTGENKGIEVSMLNIQNTLFVFTDLDSFGILEQLCGL